jgi:hypothetical protein
VCCCCLFDALIGARVPAHSLISYIYLTDLSLACLALLCRGFSSFGAVVDAWAGEALSYNFSRPGFSLLAGHFSQLVWRSSSKMGCAFNAACEWEVYRCLYYPPGNDVAADWSQQVMPDIKHAADIDAGASDAPYTTWVPVTPAPAPPENPAVSAAAGGSSSKPSGADVATYIPFNVPDGVASSSLVVPDAWSNAQQQQQEEVPPEEQPVPMQQQEIDADSVAASPEPLKDGTPVPTMPAAQFFTPPAVLPAPSAAAPVAPTTPTTPDTPATPAVTPAPATPTGAGAAPSEQQPAPSPAPTTAAPQTAVSSDPSVPAEFAAVLAATNAYRAKHQAPALVWDAALAARAQAHAGGCPNGHSGDRGVGENLGEAQLAALHCCFVAPTYGAAMQDGLICVCAGVIGGQQPSLAQRCLVIQ